MHQPVAGQVVVRHHGERVQTATADQLKALLPSYPSDRLKMWPVSKAVNDVRNEDAASGHVGKRDVTSANVGPLDIGAGERLHGIFL